MLLTLHATKCYSISRCHHILLTSSHHHMLSHPPHIITSSYVITSSSHHHIITCHHILITSSSHHMYITWLSLSPASLVVQFLIFLTCLSHFCCITLHHTCFIPPHQGRIFNAKLWSSCSIGNVGGGEVRMPQNSNFMVRSWFTCYYLCFFK